MNALETSNRLILYLDFKSPYAYLAKDPAKQLEREFGIEIDWRPLTLNIPSFSWFCESGREETGYRREQNAATMASSSLRLLRCQTLCEVTRYLDLRTSKDMGYESSSYWVAVRTRTGSRNHDVVLGLCVRTVLEERNRCGEHRRD